MTTPVTTSAPSDGALEVAARRKRMLTGDRPTGKLHLGHFVGSVENRIRLQEEYEAFFIIADLHMLTPKNARADIDQVSTNARDMVLDQLSAGIDPEKATFYLQSAIPEVSELNTLFQNLVTVPRLERVPSLKDMARAAGKDEMPYGLLGYPVLQAADILIYDANVVPVGEDQRQHLELSRDLAGRFNQRFGDTLVVPEPHIMKATAKIQDLQEPTAKMSKSAASDTGLVSLLDEPARIAKKIRSAVTDAEREIRFDEENKPGISNLLSIHSALSGTPVAILEEQYAGKGYGDLKKDVAEVVVEAVTPFRTRTLELMADPGELDRILADGAERARAVAEATVRRVYDKVGLLPVLGRNLG